MMTCLEFRRRVGAEPAAADADVACSTVATAPPALATRMNCARWTG